MKVLEKMLWRVAVLCVATAFLPAVGAHAQQPITLTAVLCHDTADASCVEEQVVTSDQADMTWMGCQGIGGQTSAINFMRQSPLYHTWRLKAWHCSWGAKALGRSA